MSDPTQTTESEPRDAIFWEQRATLAVATVRLMAEFLEKKGLFGEYQGWLLGRIRTK
jgi:hypothetical protein